ncbi:MAG: hypothetical protein Q8P20_05925 [bacterium]|nr:hypothetical protein [bacterium]
MPLKYDFFQLFWLLSSCFVLGAIMCFVFTFTNAVKNKIFLSFVGAFLFIMASLIFGLESFFRYFTGDLEQEKIVLTIICLFAGVMSIKIALSAKK